MSLYQPTITDLFHTHLITAVYQICVTFAEVAIPFVDRKSYDCIKRLKATQSQYRLEYYSRLSNKVLSRYQAIQSAKNNYELESLVDIDERFPKIHISDIIMRDHNMSVIQKYYMTHYLIYGRCDIWKYEFVREFVSILREQAGPRGFIWRSRTSDFFTHLIYISVPIVMDKEWFELLRDVIIKLDKMGELIHFIHARLPKRFWNHRSLLIRIAYSIDPERTINELGIDGVKFNKLIKTKYVKVDSITKEMKLYQSIIDMELALKCK